MVTTDAWVYIPKKPAILEIAIVLYPSLAEL